MTEKLFEGGIDMWGNLMATQQLFDNKVSQVHRVVMDSGIVHNQQIMALRDEVMEYAKATKCFKYWSLKDPDPIQVRIEEFADGLHFYLQQALRLGLNPQDLLDESNQGKKAAKYFGKNTNKKEVLTLFLSRAMDHLKTPASYEEFHDPFEERSEIELMRKDIKISFQFFMAAGYSDGFTDQEIETAYYLKNAINQDRLKSGY